LFISDLLDFENLANPIEILTPMLHVNHKSRRINIWGLIFKKGLKGFIDGTKITK